MAGTVGNTQQRQVPMNFGMAANPLIGGAKGGAGGIQRRMDPYGYNAQSFQMSGLPNNYMNMAVGPQVTVPQTAQTAPSANTFNQPSQNQNPLYPRAGVQFGREY